MLISYNRNAQRTLQIHIKSIAIIENGLTSCYYIHMPPVLAQASPYKRRRLYPDTIQAAAKGNRMNFIVSYELHGKQHVSKPIDADMVDQFCAFAEGMGAWDIKKDVEMSKYDQPSEPPDGDPVCRRCDTPLKNGYEGLNVKQTQQKGDSNG